MNREKTREDYRNIREEDLCDCEDCRLFYRTFASSYPEVSSYLETLGIDARKPLETMPLFRNEEGVMVYCGPQYVIMGSPGDFEKTEVGGVSFKVTDSHPYTGIDEEHFVIELSEIDLKEAV